MNELKPCPWCGENPEIIDERGVTTDYVLIRCSNDNCHCVAECADKTEKAAIAAWNTRANPQPANEVKLWVAADEDGAMMAFTEPPIRFYGMEHYWKGIGRRRWPSKLFGFTPVMTWKDSPRRVTVRVTIGGTS